METGDYGPSASGLFEVEALHRVIRDTPKPVIAAVNGLAIGGGHVLHVLCDLTIAADTAHFGQNGPRVGSFDAGLGSGYLARVVGEKRAREIWFMLRRLSRRGGDGLGPGQQGRSRRRPARRGPRLGRSNARLLPHRAQVLKQSINTDTEHFVSIGTMAYSTLEIFGETPEAREGITAFNEKRKPDFTPYRGK